MTHNPFSAMTRRDWTLWLTSLVMVALANVLSGGTDALILCATLAGVTALIFMALGDAWGQLLTAAFSVLYALVSWRQRYYGEMITYLGMTLPMALAALVSWLRHPYEAGRAEVAISRLSGRHLLIGGVSGVGVTIVFCFILLALDTPELPLSTLSIFTSYAAAYLTWRRSSLYALGYAANDAVLILLWLIAARQDPSRAPMAVCFLMFLVNDLYGFFCWKRRERRQGLA